MKVLHLLRSEPDATVVKITHAMSAEHTMIVVALYEVFVDWAALVDMIFEYDQVICWW